MGQAGTTMTDIAKKAGVSKNTVSLALRYDPQIPDSTRKRIQKIAAQLKYHKNPTVAHLMAQLRAGRNPHAKPLLGLINANLDRDAFLNHPTVPVYVEGCQKRAEELGYRLDEFWLHQKGLQTEKFNRMLKTRNIRGLLVVGLMSDNKLPERFHSTWETFPTVVTGVRTRDPALSFSCTDHHMLMIKAVDKALALGYKRPALVLDRQIDRLVEGRFSAGFHTAVRELPKAQRPNPFYRVEEARKNPLIFKAWVQQEQPDVILTLYQVVERWLQELTISIPRDMGLIQLDRRRNSTEWAGMDQHNDVVGAAAVEMLISMLHNNEASIPLFPKATLIGSTWVDGKTCRKSKSRTFPGFQAG